MHQLNFLWQKLFANFNPLLKMVSQWPFYLNFIYKTFDHFNSQILSKFCLLERSEQHYLINQNDKFRDYFASIQKIYIVYKRIKNSYAFFTSSLKQSKDNGFLPLTGSASFIQIDQLLMNMMDDLINFDLYLVCENIKEIEPVDQIITRTLGNDSCPVCLFPMGNQLLDDEMWKFHRHCFNFNNHFK